MTKSVYLFTPKHNIVMGTWNTERNEVEINGIFHAVNPDNTIGTTHSKFYECDNGKHVVIFVETEGQNEETNQ